SLALIGIYGVVAYTVAQRRMELALRLTLGATRTSVLAMVMQRGMRPVWFGLLGGLVLCLAASRAVRSLLFGVTPLDPVTIASATFACLLPAYAVVRIDPGKALRYE